MKKILISCIFTCIMLMVPITNVVSASDTVEDCNCNPISDSQVVRIERLLDRLESSINFILLRYGHIPEVKEKCEEIRSKGGDNKKNISTFIQSITYNTYG